MKSWKTVDEYLAALPPKERRVLAVIRKSIRSAAPKAQEVISYGMPGYKQDGMLVYFAAFKNHLSLFGGRLLLTSFAKELKNFHTKGSTIHFTVDNPLPVPLVKKIVRARLKENVARAKLRAAKKK